jgi:hypothetical protein
VGSPPKAQPTEAQLEAADPEDAMEKTGVDQHVDQAHAKVNHAACPEEIEMGKAKLEFGCLGTSPSHATHQPKDEDNELNLTKPGLVACKNPKAGNMSSAGIGLSATALS